MSWGVYRPYWQGVPYPSQNDALATLTAGIAVITAVGSAAGASTVSGVSPSVVTWNPSDKGSGITLSNGDLTGTHTGTVGTHYVVRSNVSGSSGRYFEFVFSALTSSSSMSGIGIANTTQPLSGTYVGNANSIGYYANGYYEGPAGFTSGGTTFATGDVLGVYLKSTSVEFYKNGTLLTAYTTLPSGTLYAALDVVQGGDAGTANFGATTLSYLPAGATSWDGSQTGASGSVGASSGAATVSGVGASTFNAVGASAGASTVTAVGAATANSIGAAAGAATVTAVGASTFNAVGAAAGASTVTAVGASTFKAVGAAAGASTVTAVGAATANSIGAAAGASTVTAVGASTFKAVGASAGASTVTAVGAATANSIGAAAGTSTVTAVGAATVNSIGAAAGASTVTAVGASTAASVGASSGAATVTATSAATAASVGASSGAATVSAVSAIAGAGVATSAGVGTATGVGAAIFNAVGASAGVGTVTGVGLGGTLVTLDPAKKSATITLSGGNLTATGTSTGDAMVQSTVYRGAGYYFECVGATGVGVGNTSANLDSYYDSSGGGDSQGYYGSGEIFGAGEVHTPVAAFNKTTDIIGVAVDASGTQIRYYKNGTLQRVTNFAPTGNLFAQLEVDNTEVATVNFGATAMAYLPVGYYSWDGSQLGTATISATGAAAGVNTAAATGVAIANSVGASAGVSTVQGQGTVPVSGVGAAAGASTVTAEGSAITVVPAVGASAGASTCAAVGEGVSFVTATGTALGVSHVAGVSLYSTNIGNRFTSTRYLRVPSMEDTPTIPEASRQAA